MTFEKWLKRQRRRDDPVGDLARDLISDIGKNRRSIAAAWLDREKFFAKTITFVKLREHLNDVDACPGAFDALDRAEKEYLAL